MSIDHNIDNDFYSIKGNEDRLKQIFHMYQKNRYRENYNQRSIEYLINSHRFSYGLLETKFRGQLVCFCGFSIFQKWIVATRYINFYDLKTPFFLGSAVPWILKKIQQDSYLGLALTFNEKNLGLKFLAENQSMNNNTIDLDIYDKKNQLIKRFRSLPDPVLYYRTKQYVLYIPLGDQQPDFKPYPLNSH